MPGRRAFAAVFLVALIAIAAIATRGVVQHYEGVLAEARDLRAGLGAFAGEAKQVGPTLDQPTLDRLNLQFEQLAGKFEDLAGTLRYDPLIGMLRHVPYARDQIAAADHLMAAGQHLIDAANAMIPLGQQYVTARAKHHADPLHDSQLADLVTLMATTLPSAERAQADLAAANRQLADIPASGLIHQIGDARDLLYGELSKYGPLLDTYVNAAKIVPGILGWGGEKRYLILAEDSAELRPTGGFIGTYGIMGFDDGRIVEKGFKDIYLLDLKPGLPYVAPPAALQRHLLRPNASWGLRDSNWSPDFPTAAAEALKLYELESGDTRIDGVIAMTTVGMDTLLNVTGPITVPEYGVKVAAGQTAAILLAHTRVSTKPGVNRKVFVADFADQVMASLLTLHPQEWPTLVKELGVIGQGHQALAWFVDPTAQQLVEQYGWSGAVRQGPGDYMFLVDASVRPSSKIFAVTTRSEALSVQLGADDRARSTLKVSWDNGFSGNGGILRGIQPLNARNLGDYARVLIPLGSRFQGLSGDRPWHVAVPADAPQTVLSTDAGRLAIGRYHQIPVGTTTLTYHWTTPPVVQELPEGDLYQLVVQKQPGTPNDAISVSITVPPGAQLIAAPGMTIQGSTATLQTTLSADLVLQVWYVPPPAAP